MLPRFGGAQGDARFETACDVCSSLGESLEKGRVERVSREIGRYLIKALLGEEVGEGVENIFLRKQKPLAQRRDSNRVPFRKETVGFLMQEKDLGNIAMSGRAAEFGQVVGGSRNRLFQRGVGI